MLSVCGPRTAAGVWFPCTPSQLVDVLGQFHKQNSDAPEPQRCDFLLLIDTFIVRGYSWPYSACLPCRCPLKCNARISEDERQKIFAEYWGLADYNLQREYLAAHMQREEKLGPSGLLRTVILYFLTSSKHTNTKLQVCVCVCLCELLSNFAIDSRTTTALLSSSPHCYASYILYRHFLSSLINLGPPLPPPPHRSAGNSSSKRWMCPRKHLGLFWRRWSAGSLAATGGPTPLPRAP